jgi:hypothetical protein
MGRYILGGKEARLPYEVEELNLRLYTVEELCYYIYNNLPLIGDDFIDERLLAFLRKELGQEEIADKIEKFYVSPSDQDATLIMLLSDVGYYSDTELKEFQNRLVSRKKKTGPERVMNKADLLYEKKRYVKALFYYWRIASDRDDVRISQEMRSRAYESMASAYAHLSEFPRVIQTLEDAYDVSRQERLLKKLYGAVMLFGSNLPEKYFANVPSTLIAAWDKEYRSLTAVNRMQAEESEIMGVFFMNEKEAAEKLEHYLETEKEKFRSMIE